MANTCLSGFSKPTRSLISPRSCIPHTPPAFCEEVIKPPINLVSESVPLQPRAKAAKSRKLRFQAIPLGISEKTPGDKDPCDMARQVKHALLSLTT